MELDQKKSAMKVKELRDLIDFIKSTGLEEVNIETEQFKLKVKRSSDVSVHHVAPPSSVPAPTTISTSGPSFTEAQNQALGEASKDNFLNIKSPMIGTLYMAANP